jgi:hypothetical protein
MKAKVLAGRSTREATENRAIGCQVSGRCAGNIHVISDADFSKILCERDEECRANRIDQADQRPRFLAIVLRCPSFSSSTLYLLRHARMDSEWIRKYSRVDYC